MEENPYEPSSTPTDYKPVDWKRVAFRVTVFLLAGYFAIAFALSALVVIMGNGDQGAALVLGLFALGTVAATIFWATRK